MGLQRKKITVHGRKGTYQRSVMVRSEKPKSFLRRHGGKIAAGLVLAAGVGYAAHKLHQGAHLRASRQAAYEGFKSRYGGFGDHVQKARAAREKAADAFWAVSRSSKPRRHPIHQLGAGSGEPPHVPAVKVRTRAKVLGDHSAHGESGLARTGISSSAYDAHNFLARSWIHAGMAKLKTVRLPSGKGSYSVHTPESRSLLVQGHRASAAAARVAGLDSAGRYEQRAEYHRTLPARKAVR